MRNGAKKLIEEGKSFLGIEFGSTRIKAVVIDEEESPLPVEVMSGRTALIMGSGPIPLRISGVDCRTAIRIF